MLMPNNVRDCHILILAQKEQIEDLKLYSGMDVSTERRSRNLQTYDKIKKDLASKVGFKQESSAGGAAKMLLALYLAPPNRVCPYLTLQQLLLGLMTKKPLNSDLADSTVKVYVALARTAFRIMGLNDPINCSWGDGYILTPDGRKYVEQFL